MSLVSIIVPCYNEQSTIQLLLKAVYNQSYPKEEMEVVIADGGSSDNTLQEIALFAQGHKELHVIVVQNNGKGIPSALNKAVKASSGALIVRMDAHSVPDPEYISHSVEDLTSGKGDNVGGVWEIKPGSDHWISRAIAIAAAHPLGVGDARYRYTTQAGNVDTVPFGAYMRKMYDQIGGYDEKLLANEDYEFNVRIRQAGGKIWLNPQIHTVYFARPTLKSLAKQYWRYGYWKWQMLRRYPHTIRWRQALPPLFVGSLFSTLILSPWVQPALWILVAELVIYEILIGLSALWVAIQKKDILMWPGIQVAITCMHISWGSGFLWSMISTYLKAIKKNELL